MMLLTFKFVKENFSSNPLDLTNSYPSHLINLIPNTLRKMSQVFVTGSVCFILILFVCLFVCFLILNMLFVLKFSLVHVAAKMCTFHGSALVETMWCYSCT